MNSSWHNIKSVWLHVHFRDKNKSSYVRLFVSHKVITVEEVVKHSPPPPLGGEGGIPLYHVQVWAVKQKTKKNKK